MTKAQKLLVDELDIAILTHLEQDGRKSLSDIAADLGVTVSTVGNRLKRLIDEEILSIHGFLDPHQVGFNVPALILVSAKPTEIERVGMEIAKFPEVLAVIMITGDFGLSVEVQCRDTDHLTELLLNRLQRISGIRETRTSILLREIKVKQPSVTMLLSDIQD